jgi:hypothetical protein
MKIIIAALRTNIEKRSGLPRSFRDDHDWSSISFLFSCLGFQSLGSQRLLVRTVSLFFLMNISKPCLTNNHVFCGMTSRKKSQLCSTNVIMIAFAQEVVA